MAELPDLKVNQYVALQDGVIENQVYIEVIPVRSEAVLTPFHTRFRTYPENLKTLQRHHSRHTYPPYTNFQGVGISLTLAQREYSSPLSLGS